MTRDLCDTCAAGRWERSRLAGTLIFVHADGTREVYYECETCDSDDECEDSP
jgi:hypothetical protein